MTSERADAYGRVTRMLEELGATKLQPGEQTQIRESADALFFAEDDASARMALAGVEALAARLVESDRWTRERADALVGDVAACGPPTVRA